MGDWWVPFWQRPYSVSLEEKREGKGEERGGRGRGKGGGKSTGFDGAPVVGVIVAPVVSWCDAFGRVLIEWVLDEVV